MEAALLGPSGRTILESAVVTIGHTADNHCVVNDAKVSSYHAEIRLIGQGYSIIDLSSTHGTFVNEQRLESAVPHPLTTGDMIRIGDTAFKYEVSDVSHVTPGASALVGQANNHSVVPAPFESTAYGRRVGEDYQFPPFAHLFSTPQPYQQPFTPPPDYQPYTLLLPPQHSYGSFAAADGTAKYPAPVLSQPYVQQSYPLPEAMSGAPAYAAPAPQPSSTLPPTQRKPSSGMRILLIVLVIILVLGVGSAGIATYLFTRPQPVIRVTSDYHVGSTPAGSTGTVFHVSGHTFAGASVITFLLDGLSVPGNSRVASDADGKVKVDLTVTNAWAVGSHILTAKDADGNVTKGAMSVLVVPQGQAHTPGPHGAPADDMSFTLNVNSQYQDVATGKQYTYAETLVISGRPDPAGGIVCQTFDDGQPQTYSGDAGNGITYTETITFTCSGAYKGGKLSYIETATSDKIDYSNGISCVGHTPYVYWHLEGAFNAPNSMSGTLSADGFTADCTKGLGTRYFDAYQGTWTGQL